MYLNNLSPAEDGIRLQPDIGYTHLPAFDM
jgi:hypothetical protein